MQGTVKKIRDVNFDPLPNTSTSDVKIDQSSSRSSITHDEFAKMIHVFFFSVVDKFNKLMDSYTKREEKKSGFFVFFLMMLLLVDRSWLLVNLNMGCRLAFVRDNRYALAKQLKLVYLASRTDGANLGGLV